MASTTRRCAIASRRIISSPRWCWASINSTARFTSRRWTSTFPKTATSASPSSTTSNSGCTSIRALPSKPLWAASMTCSGYRRSRTSSRFWRSRRHSRSRQKLGRLSTIFAGRAPASAADSTGSFTRSSSLTARNHLENGILQTIALKASTSTAPSITPRRSRRSPAGTPGC